MEMTDPVSTRKMAGVPWMWPWMEYDAVGLTEYTTLLSAGSGLAVSMLPCSVRPGTLRVVGSCDLASVAPSGVWPVIPRASRFPDWWCVLVGSGGQHILWPGAPLSCTDGKRQGLPL